MNDELLTAALHHIADRAQPVDGLADRALRSAARRRTDSAGDGHSTRAHLPGR